MYYKKEGMKKLLLILGLTCTQLSFGQTKEKVTNYKVTYTCTKCGEVTKIYKMKPTEVKDKKIAERVASDNQFDAAFTYPQQYKTINGYCSATGNKHLWKTSWEKYEQLTFFYKGADAVAIER